MMTSHSQGRPGLVSDDPTHYSTYAVYFMDHDPACEELRNLVGDRTDVLFKNVAEIPRDRRPPWLSGVPTVVRIADFAVLRGTAALNELRQWRDSELKGPQGSGGCGSAALGFPLQGELREQQVGEDPRYAEEKEKGGGDVALRAYLERRGISSAAGEETAHSSSDEMGTKAAIPPPPGM